MLAVLTQTLAPTPLRAGTVIAKSTRVAPGEYRLASGEGTTRAGEETIPTFIPAITVKGNGITVDFTGVTLRGSASTLEPDARRGLGVRVEGNDVTIKGLRVRGYRVALLAQGCRGLRLLDCDFSYGWKPRLKSTPEREDLSDWMSFHHNENGEWLRYGAGAYLDRCPRFEVRNLRVRDGSCGLMLDRCDGGLVWNSDLSFNSGLGLGMYRSSGNRVMHNRIDWDVRGFSYGVYNRGQDSAGVLVFEQCQRNVFAYNSVTHGGDGFFLWAGQSTMDTGAGGCNDNLLYGNDFSHAVTNGIEATFSRNRFVYNKVHECAHGVWGGYSYDSLLLGNEFKDNQAAVAIEHGQRNRIERNRFESDDVAVSLWANERQDPNLGYVKTRDTASHGTAILANSFWKDALAIDLRRTSDARINLNSFLSVGRALRTETGGVPPLNPHTATLDMNSFYNGTPVPALLHAFPKTEVDLPDKGWYPGPTRWSPLQITPVHRYANGTSSYSGELTMQQVTPEILRYKPAPLKGGMEPYLKTGTRRGWSAILVDEWGPYDFQRPILWPERKALQGEAPRPGADSAPGSGRRKRVPVMVNTSGPVRYEILGPKGRWRLLKHEGVRLSATQGTVPGWVTITPVGKGSQRVAMEYVGKGTVDHRGVYTPAGKPVRFGFDHFRAPIDWTVRFYRWSESENPADPHANPKAFADVLHTAPIKTLTTDRLDFAGAAPVPGLPTDHYATQAEGTFTAKPGEYALEVTADDGARVWIDDRLVIDAWKYQGPTLYSADLRLGGRHRIRVEHFQIDGYAALKVELRPSVVPK